MIGNTIGSEPSFSGSNKEKCLVSMLKEKLFQIFDIDNVDTISVLSLKSNLRKKVSSETNVPSKSKFQSLKSKLPFAEKEPL